MEEQNVNNKVINVFAFLAGAALGSVVTWKLIEKKYKDIADEEIESVKEYYSKKETALNNEVKKAHILEGIQKNNYTKIVEDLDYNHSNEENNENKANIDNDIYIIPPESFAENDDYKITTLTSYNGDKTLTNEHDEIIRDIEEIIGEDPSIHFGEFEDDSVYVRNDKLRTDYEILLDLRSYDEAMSITSKTVDNSECETE